MNISFVSRTASLIRRCFPPYASMATPGFPDPRTVPKVLEYVLNNATTGDPASVVAQFDKFGWEQEWMMALGDVKGKFLDDAIAAKQPCKRVLEIGLFCGYSAVRIASQIPEDGQVYSIEPDQAHIEAATQIIAKAGLSHKVTILPGKGYEVIPTLKGKTFDLVFIDHLKSAYLSDLKLIEENGLLEDGSVVVADNVVFHGLEKYLDHVRNSGKYKSSVLHKAELEYVPAGGIADGVEVSVYKGS